MWRRAVRVGWVVALALVCLVFSDAASWADSPSITITYGSPVEGDLPGTCRVTFTPTDPALSSGAWDVWDGADAASAVYDGPEPAGPLTFSLEASVAPQVFAAVATGGTPVAGDYVAFDASACEAVAGYVTPSPTSTPSPTDTPTSTPTPTVSPSSSSTPVAVDGFSDFTATVTVGLALILFVCTATFVILWKR